QQADRLQRLTQIMAGGGKEPGLGEIGLLGLPLGSLQRYRGMPALGDVFNRQENLARGGRLVANLKRAHEQRSHAPRRQLDVDFVILDHSLTFAEAVKVGERSADVAGDNAKQRLGRWREKADVEVAVQEQRRDAGAVQDVLQVVRRAALPFERFLYLTVDGRKLFIKRLQLLPRGHQLFIGRLEFVIRRHRLLVVRLVLVIGYL